MTAYVLDAGRWTSPLLRPADEAVATWAAERLTEVGSGADALCVATLDAGARESVHFWRESLATGLAFANPRPFAWTLSNSPTGRIAQRLGVRGPTFTLVGRAEALTAALQHALAELDARRALRVLVAAMDGAGDDHTRLSAALLAADAEAEALATLAAGDRPFPEAIVARATASETLAAALARVADRGEAALGTDRAGWVVLAPR